MNGDESLVVALVVAALLAIPFAVWAFGPSGRRWLAAADAYRRRGYNPPIVKHAERSVSPPPPKPPSRAAALFGFTYCGQCGSTDIRDTTARHPAT